MVVISLLLTAVCREPARGQSDSGYCAGWFHRVDKTQAEQPHWITPLATTTPRLEQEFRYDVLWQQPRPGAPYSENYGNGKGLELIPLDKVEIIVGLPPYITQHNPTVEDGFGDVRLLIKYRLLAANEERGKYIMTAFMDVSVPTGSGTNGQANAVATPTLAYGKGFGYIDVQGTIGVALPLGNEDRIGGA